jgi:hypothetical protein
MQKVLLWIYIQVIPGLNLDKVTSYPVENFCEFSTITPGTYPCTRRVQVPRTRPQILTVFTIHNNLPMSFNAAWPLQMKQLINVRINRQCSECKLDTVTWYQPP